MDRIQWIARCDKQLRRLAPDVVAEIGLRVAIALWEAHQHETPEDAADREADKWLKPLPYFKSLASPTAEA